MKQQDPQPESGRSHSSAPGDALEQQWETPWYRLPLTWLLTAVIALVVGLLAGSGYLTRLESISTDWRFMQRGAQPLAARVVVVEIDQLTLDDPAFKEPLLFWGGHHARVFQTLNDMGARAIGFDIVQPVTPGEYAIKDPNQVQAETVAAMPNLVMAYTRTLLPDGSSRDNLPNEVLRTASALGGGRMGFANTVPDADSVVRRFAPFDSDGSPSFPLQIAAAASGKEPTVKNSIVSLGDRRFTTDALGQIVIDYVGPAGTIPRVSYRDLLAHPNRFKTLLKGSICLIGATGLDQQDIHIVPLARKDAPEKLNMMPGVEIHANIVHTLLEGQDIHSATNGQTWLLIAAAALLTVPLAWMLRIGFVVPALALVLAAWMQACTLAFNNASLLLPLVPVALAFGLNSVLLSSARLWQENRQKKTD